LADSKALEKAGVKVERWGYCLVESWVERMGEMKV
jgi:hypothetical protein